MEKQKTKIDGLEIIPLEVNFDDRGYLFEIIHHYDMPKFGQVYIIGDQVRGIIRAFHKHQELWDYFCIVKGSALMIENKVKPIKKRKQLFYLKSHQKLLLFLRGFIMVGCL